jgi:hypothetical protein
MAKGIGQQLTPLVRGSTGEVWCLSTGFQQGWQAVAGRFAAFRASSVPLRVHWLGFRRAFLGWRPSTPRVRQKQQGRLGVLHAATPGQPGTQLTQRGIMVFSRSFLARRHETALTAASTEPTVPVR